MQHSQESTWRPEALLKRDSNNVFPANIVKFWRISANFEIYFEEHQQTTTLLERLQQTTLHSQVWKNFWQLKSLLKRWKISFYFTIKTIFVLEIFKLLFWLFGHVGKRLDKKAKVNFKIYEVTNLVTGNYTYCQISHEVKTIKKWNVVS